MKRSNLVLVCALLGSACSEKVPPPLKPDARGVDVPGIGRPPGAWITRYRETDEGAEVHYGIQVSMKTVTKALEKAFKEGGYAIREAPEPVKSDDGETRHWVAFNAKSNMTVTIDADAKTGGKPGSVDIGVEYPKGTRLYDPKKRASPTAAQLAPLGADVMGADLTGFPRPPGSFRRRYDEKPGEVTVHFMTKASQDDVTSALLEKTRAAGHSPRSWVMYADDGTDTDNIEFFNPADKTTTKIEISRSQSGTEVAMMMEGGSTQWVPAAAQTNVQPLDKDGEGADPEGIARAPGSWRLSSGDDEGGGHANYRSTATLDTLLRHYDDVAEKLGFTKKDWRVHADPDATSAAANYFRPNDSAELSFEISSNDKNWDIALQWKGNAGQAAPKGEPQTDTP